jgi:hypothetical protein
VSPYGAPAAAAPTRPSAILWYRVFAVSAGLLYVFLAVVAAVVSGGIAGRDDHELVLISVMCALPALVFYGVAAAVPYKPWGWTYALVAIALGLPTILAPASVVLLVFWNRPLVKAAFGRL